MNHIAGFEPNTKQKALEWLYRDELLNLMSIDMLERDLLTIAWSGKDALLLEGPEDFLIHCLCKDEWPDLLEVLLTKLPRDRFIILRAHQEWFVEELSIKTGFTEVVPYFNSIYPNDFPLSSSLPPNVVIRPLTMGEFGFVRSVYQTVDDDQYIRERIDAGMLGAWYDGTLAGFIGTHQEGTVGLLEVLPEFRRRGIGRALEEAMLRRLREKGLRAYGNIAAGNELSRTVHEKIGIKIGDCPVYWLFSPDYGITQ